MSDPISLRKIPPESLKLAQEMSAQTGLSINDVFRLALSSGLLIEVTKLAPSSDGTQCGLSGAWLAKALRRHLGAAIDLLLEYDQHPYQALMKSRQEQKAKSGTEQAIPPTETPINTQHVGSSIGDDLDALGIGFGLAASEPDQE